MREDIINTLKQLEKDLVVLHKAVYDNSLPNHHKGPVSFKFLHDMIKYNTLKALVPDYESAEIQEIVLAQGMLESAKMVTVEGDKIIISPQFEELMKMQINTNGKIS